MLEKHGEFEAPATLKRPLFAHQLTAVVENLVQGRRINAHEMGLGKTMVALTLCEHLGFERILWVTGAANKADAKAEILANVDIDPNLVVVVPGDASRWTKAENEQHINGAKYLVCAY